MTYEQLNDDPPRETWAWGVTYRDEPAKGKPSVHVSVRVTREFARSNIDEIAAELKRRFGWIVYKGSGWGFHDHCPDPDGLVVLGVSVRAREIRAALADPAYQAAKAIYEDPPGETTAERDVQRFEAVLEMRRLARTAR